jgi:hypothetical protein
VQPGGEIVADRDDDHLLDVIGGSEVEKPCLDLVGRANDLTPAVIGDTRQFLLAIAIGQRLLDGWNRPQEPLIKAQAPEIAA